MRRCQCRGTRRMIGVTVRHEYACKAGAALVKMVVDRREMPRLADPRIDERSLPVRSDEQVGVVAPGHWTPVVAASLIGGIDIRRPVANARNQNYRSAQCVRVSTIPLPGPCLLHRAMSRRPPARLDASVPPNHGTAPLSSQ